MWVERKTVEERKKFYSYFLNKGLTFSLGMILTDNVAGSAHGCEWKIAKEFRRGTRRCEK